jgi:uncharacterized protein
MQLITVKIEKPDDTNFILGQTHFIKTVEDIHEALVGAVPSIKFGLAFCEASGKCLVRWSGTDAAMIELAKKKAAAIGAGHSFIIFLGDGVFVRQSRTARVRRRIQPRRSGRRASSLRPAAESRS